MADGKGQSYDAEFRHSTFLSYLWSREKRVLRELFEQENRSRDSDVTYLDFACGTGRIISELEGLASRAVGLDISPAMLVEARSRVKSAELLLGNAFEDPSLLTDTFDVATSFRFFPNADPALRARAADFLHERVKPGGLLIVNNHQNAGSMLCTMARMVGKKWPWTEAYNHEIVDLLTGAGFELEGRHGLGMLPGTARRAYFPIWLHAAADGVGRGLGGSGLAQDVIMWFRRA